MRKLAIVITLGLFFILRAAASFATVDLSIGGTAWYIWWDPAWKDGRMTTKVYTMSPSLLFEDARDFQPNSNIMGGPVISIAFLDRWSIQSVFTIGRFRYNSRGLVRTGMLEAGRYEETASYKRYMRSILKWDSDTSIGCAINRVVKIFAGFKSQGYRYKEYLDDYLISEDIFNRVLKDEVSAYGCGLGIGLTIPLVEHFYLMMSASGLALWTREKASIDHWRTIIISTKDGIYPIPMMAGKGSFFSYGGTAALSFSYVIQKINTTISAGGRYQLLFNRQRYNDLLNNDVAMNIIDKQYDHFFGVTLSAIYTFHIGKKG